MYAHNVTLWRVHVTIVAVEKQEVLHIHVFAAFVIQHAKRMRHIIVLSVACPSVEYFFLHYLINDTISGKRILNIKCVLVLPPTLV
jgi:hypothetical protein